jgi:NAD(P)-dependent dehydrogenase (short-subunit alcohol dehydrogenase family)
MRSLFNLENQKIVISGSGGSIGSAAAHAMASLGADLYLIDLSAPQQLASELRQSGSKVEAFSLDITNRTDVDKLFAEIGRIDALCDTVGYYAGSNWLEGGADWEESFYKTINVNILGPLNLVRAVLPGMIERRNGRIALTSSMAARTAGSTPAVEPAYVASKGGLQALVRSFARQAAPYGVVVNAVAPGPVLTPLMKSTGQAYQVDSFPMKRFGEPWEIGWPLAFLCSKAANYMTGAVIDVNGGMAFS